MARRLNTRQSEQTASAIQTTKIVKRLQEHVFGEIEMTPQQVNSARILLAKTLPDQKAIEHQADGPLTVQVVQYGANTNPE